MNEPLKFGDKERNKELVEKYPFLLPRNRWTGEVAEDYDYDYTEANDIPRGWWIRFGIQLLDDIKNILEKHNCLEDYRISQIKEKWGELRWYDWGAPDELLICLDNWEYISRHTCIKCGEFPVIMRNDGWVSPYCDKCFKETHENLTDEQLDKYTSHHPFDKYLYEYYYSVDLKPYYEKIGIACPKCGAYLKTWMSI